ncbi:MAG: LysM peptidoglycan-binding domain-containing protein [Hyphomicrobiaceae bacterium]|nr:LysM peptidoglycan-binding domain-containing protein [Hyphomicrobiaceae bacterium]
MEEQAARARARAQTPAAPTPPQTHSTPISANAAEHWNAPPPASAPPAAQSPESAIVSAAEAHNAAVSELAAYESALAAGMPPYAMDPPAHSPQDTAAALDALLTTTIDANARLNESEADRARYRVDVHAGQGSPTPDRIAEAAFDLAATLDEAGVFTPEVAALLGQSETQLRNRRITDQTVFQIEQSFAEDGLEGGLQTADTLLLAVTDPELRASIADATRIIAGEHGLFDSIDTAEAAGPYLDEDGVFVPDETLQVPVEEYDEEARLRRGAELATIAPPEIAALIADHLQGELDDVLSIHTVDDPRHQTSADAAIDNAAAIIGKAAQDGAEGQRIADSYEGLLFDAYAQSVRGWQEEEHSALGALARLAEIAESGAFSGSDAGRHTRMVRLLTEAVLQDSGEGAQADVILDALYGAYVSRGMSSRFAYAVEDLAILSGATNRAGYGPDLALTLASAMRERFEAIGEPLDAGAIDLHLSEAIADGHGVSLAGALAEDALSIGDEDAARQYLEAIARGTDRLAEDNAALFAALLEHDQDLVTNITAAEALAGEEAAFDALIAWKLANPDHDRDKAAIVERLISQGAQTFATLQQLNALRSLDGTTPGDLPLLAESGLLQPIFGTEDDPGAFDRLADDPVTLLMASASHASTGGGNPLIRQELGAAYTLEGPDKSRYQTAVEELLIPGIDATPGEIRSIRSVLSAAKEVYTTVPGSDVAGILTGPAASLGLRSVSTVLYALGVYTQADTLGGGRITPGEIGFGVLFSAYTLRDATQVTGLLASHLPSVKAAIGAGANGGGPTVLWDRMAQRKLAIHDPGATLGLRLLYLASNTYRIGEGLVDAYGNGSFEQELAARLPQIAATGLLTVDGLVSAGAKGVFGNGRFAAKLAAFGARRAFGTTVSTLTGPLGWAVMLGGELIYGRYKSAAYNASNEGPMEDFLVAAGVDRDVARRISNHSGDRQSAVPFLADWFEATGMTPAEGLDLLARMEDEGVLERFIERGVHAVSDAAHDGETDAYYRGAPRAALAADSDAYVGLTVPELYALRVRELGLEDSAPSYDFADPLFIGEVIREADTSPRSLTGLTRFAETLMPGLRLDVDPGYRTRLPEVDTSLVEDIADDLAEAEDDPALTDPASPDAPDDPPADDTGPDVSGPDIPAPDPSGEDDPGATDDDADPDSAGDTPPLQDPGGTEPETGSPGAADLPPAPRIHIVETGDTLWDIAEAHSVDLFDLIAANPAFDAALADGRIGPDRNGRRDPDLVLPGEQIIVPAG